MTDNRSKLTCRYCGRTEEEHCYQFDPSWSMPYCVCPLVMACEICEEYVPKYSPGSYCRKCGHDEACHVNRDKAT